VLSQGPVGTAVVRDAWTLSRKRQGLQVLRQTPPGRVSEGRRMTRLASSRTGENSPYGMISGGGGDVGRTWWPFATMLERADTLEAIDLNRSRLRSTRPINHDSCFCDFVALRGSEPSYHHVKDESGLGSQIQSGVWSGKRKSTATPAPSAWVDRFLEFMGLWLSPTIRHSSREHSGRCWGFLVGQ